MRRKPVSGTAATRRRSLATRLIEYVLSLPRVIRITLVSLFALGITLSVSPLVDVIYVSYFFSMNTRILPAFVSATLGLIMYLLGWWLIVGTVGEKPQARIAILWYVGVGVLAVVLVIVLIAFGVSLLDIPT